MVRIIVSIVLICCAAPLAFFMHKHKKKLEGECKALFRISAVRFFPVTSLLYTFFAIVILFFSLLIVDRAGHYEKYIHEDREIAGMCWDKFPYQRPGYDYPLVVAAGRESIVRKAGSNILVLGDSFVWGHGSSNINQVWWSILSSELERRGYDCNIYAVGWPGSSTYDELSWLRYSSMIEDIQPKIIILGYFLDDPDLNSLGLGIKTYYPAALSNDGGFDFLKSLRSIFPNLYYYLDLKLMEKISLSENRFNNSEYGYSVGAMLRMFAQSPNLENYNTYVVKPLGEYVAQLNIPMIVVPTPAMPTPGYPLWDTCALHSNKVMPLFEQAGIPVYDSLDAYREYCSGGKYNEYSVISPVNIHCGPASSWFYGKYTADVLEQNYAPVLGEKRDWYKSKLSVEINDWLPFMLSPQAVQESSSAAQYIMTYPDQTEKDLVPGNFLRLPLSKRHVKLNFKHPVRLSSIKIEGEDLLSAEVHTLAINQELGFDDQKPISLGKRRGSHCAWEDKGERYITSLLISAKTKGGKQASLDITIEGKGGEEAFF